MPPGVWNQEWLPSNELRRYPLADDAGATDVTGTFALPDSFLIAAYLAVPAALDVDPSRFFLRSVAALPGGFALGLAYDAGAGDPTPVASVTVDRASLVEYGAYGFRGLPGGPFADVEGRIALGTTADVDLQPAGLFVFDPAGGRLDPDCVRPQIRGISSLTVVDGAARSAPLYGDVELVAGDNVALSVVTGDGGTTIRIDAIDGAGLNEPCECIGVSPEAPLIRTINGIAGDAQGRFTIAGNACVAVTPTAGGLVLSDTCAQPCCGSAELDSLRAQVRFLGDEAATLANLIGRLQGAIGQTSEVILGSRLNDHECTSC